MMPRLKQAKVNKPAPFLHRQGPIYLDGANKSMAFELKGKGDTPYEVDVVRLPGLDNGSRVPWNEAKVNKNVKESVAKAMFLRGEDC